MGEWKKTIYLLVEEKILLYIKEKHFGYAVFTDILQLIVWLNSYYSACWILVFGLPECRIFDIHPKLLLSASLLTSTLVHTSKNVEISLCFRKSERKKFL